MTEHLIHFLIPTSFLLLFVLLKSSQRLRLLLLPSLSFRLLSIILLLFSVTLHISHLCTLYQSSQSATQLPCCTPTYLTTTAFQTISFSLILLSVLFVLYAPRFQSTRFFAPNNKSPPYSL